MATKLNQTQRKHAVNSLKEMAYVKQNAIRNEFDAKSENRLRAAPVLRYPSMSEALLKLAGFESSAQLAYEGEELKRRLNETNHFYVNVLFHPSNKSEVDAASTAVNERAQRYNQEVNGRISLLNNAHRRVNDLIMISDNGDEVLEALKQFEDMVF